MSSFVVSEALATGFKEGFKAGIIWLVLIAYLSKHDRSSLIRSFHAAVLTVLMATPLFLVYYSGPPAKDAIRNFISFSFSLLLILSAASLYHASGIKPDGPLDRSDSKAFLMNRFILPPLIFFLTVAFFLPDMLGSGSFIKDLAAIKESGRSTYISALAGFASGYLLWSIIYRTLRPLWIGGFFDIPQIFLFLSVTKLLGGGTKGLAEMTLIPSVQRGFMKFSHDFIHQTFVFLMVPDHQLLKTTTWNFIGFFFGPNIAGFAALAGILFFPLLFLYYRLFRPLPDPLAETGAERRKVKSGLLFDRRKKALPVMLFVLLVLGSWFSESGESLSKLYIPKPKPVVEDKGLILIPLKDPSMDIKDGRLHKFALQHNNQEIRLLVINKTGGLSVCLDACEICPPEGYGQRDSNVVCVYCNTPIPVDTLGQAGGCNPIPLSFEQDEQFIKIGLKELLKKREFIPTGAAGEKAG